MFIFDKLKLTEGMDSYGIFNSIQYHW